MAEFVQNCDCPECGGEAKAMKDKRMFLYLNCPCCGIFKYQTKTGQAKMLARINAYNARQDSKAEPEPGLETPKAEPETPPPAEPSSGAASPKSEPEPQPQKKPKKRPFSILKNRRGSA